MTDQPKPETDAAEPAGLLGSGAAGFPGLAALCVTSQAFCNMAHSAAQAQQNGNIVLQSVTAKGAYIAYRDAGDDEAVTAEGAARAGSEE